MIFETKHEKLSLRIDFERRVMMRKLCITWLRSDFKRIDVPYTCTKLGGLTSTMYSSGYP